MGSFHLETDNVGTYARWLINISTSSYTVKHPRVLSDKQSGRVTLGLSLFNSITLNLLLLILDAGNIFPFYDYL